MSIFAVKIKILLIKKVEYETTKNRTYFYSLFSIGKVTYFYSLFSIGKLTTELFQDNAIKSCNN